MIDMNRVFLVGRLGVDPTKRETKTGISVTQFSLATSRRTVSDDGVTGEETQWHRVVAWGKQADSCAEFLSKGSPVLIEGCVKSRKYDAKDGTQRTSYEIHADRVNFLGPMKKRIQAETAVSESETETRSEGVSSEPMSASA